MSEEVQPSRGPVAGSGDVAALEAKALALASERGRGSLRVGGDTAIWLDHGPDGGRRFRALSPSPGKLAAMSGTVYGAGDGYHLLEGEASPINAAIVRRLAPNLTPVKLGLRTSVGFGDRLGLATPGHVAALRRADAESVVAPVFAQQSIREMTRTRRTPQEVMDDATWGAFEAGWRHHVGADADHQKTEEDLRACLDAGFTLFTIDPGEHVDDSAQDASPPELAAKVAALPWADLEDDWSSLRARTLASGYPVDEVDMVVDDESLARAAVKYGPAIAHTARLHRALVASGRPFELELSVDETSYPTTLLEHAYIATELRRLGVEVVSLAPRFVGRFEKGVDFRPDASGDLARLARDLDGHARIARALGPYKLSLHSGSDKFSVYPIIARATGGLVHLKTAGTSYLEALRVAARSAPDLFRRALEVAHERFDTDRKSYLIGARSSAVPRQASLADADLPALLDDDDARQLLHVTFGSALDELGPELKDLLRARWREHEAVLADHFERHIAPFAAVAATA